MHSYTLFRIIFYLMILYNFIQIQIQLILLIIYNFDKNLLFNENLNKYIYIIFNNFFFFIYIF